MLLIFHLLVEEVEARCMAVEKNVRRSNPQGSVWISHGTKKNSNSESAIHVSSNFHHFIQQKYKTTLQFKTFLKRKTKIAMTFSMTVKPDKEFVSGVVEPLLWKNGLTSESKEESKRRTSWDCTISPNEAGGRGSKSEMN